MNYRSHVGVPAQFIPLVFQLLQPLMTVLLLSSALVLSSPPAQGRETSRQRDLLRLCARSPQNSRCQGQSWPILMIDRPGILASCGFLRGSLTVMGKCKVDLSATQLKIYREIGEPIEALDRQRRTSAITIPADQIFATNLQVWSTRGSGLLTAWSDDDKASLNLSFISQNLDTESLGQLSVEGKDYRSNVLTFFTEAESGFPFSAKLMQLTTLQIGAIASQLNQPSGSILSGAAAVKQLRDKKHCPRCDLRNADLSKAKLAGANLEGANLEGANLAQVNLESAYLTGANLNGANLNEANLTMARLTLTKLVGANLQAANLNGADLQLADLQSANLTQVNAEITVMQQANLADANLTEADLEGVNLTNANLENANLSGANLSDKAPTENNFSGLNGGLIGLGVNLLLGPSTTIRFVTDLSNANLENANLAGANLEDVLFTGTNLSNANLSGINLKDTDLTPANLCGATMPDGKKSDRGCIAP